MTFDDRLLEVLIKYTADHPARDTIYDFSQAYQKYMDRVHDFGDGIKMTSVEAHTLKHICQNNGVTITDIVNYWGRTKGTVSSQISAMENKGYIYKEKCKKDAKKIHIFPTEKGLEINNAHINFDVKESADLIDEWLKHYSLEELNIFFEQMTLYTDFLKKRTK